MIQLERDNFRVFPRYIPRLSVVIIVLGVLFFGSHKANGAVLYSQAANQDVYEGQTFVVDWYLDTENQSINAINLGLNFSKDNLEVVEAGSGNSLINLWIQNPAFDNQKGSISLTGGVTNGIKSDKVPVFRTVFRAKQTGSAFINLDPSSQILLNDGTGASLLLKFKNEAFNIYPKDFIPVPISSMTHPNSDSWYSSHDVRIKFELKAGQDYSYSFSSNVEIIPDNVKQNVPAEISYTNMPDGIYYFKLNSKKADGNWTEAGVFRVQIDSTPPEPFNPEIGSDSGIFEGKKFVSFSTVDKTSGISHYKVKFGRFDSAKIAETQYFQIPKFFIGDQITIEAVDNAGNIRIASIAYKSISIWWLYGIGLIVLTLLGWLIWFVAQKKKKIQTENIEINPQT
jgi:hypothetical protein